MNRPVTRIDFYVLKGSGEMARRRFACRLAEKAYRLKNTVHIQTSDAQASDQLDDLLWTFRDGSFVPHEVVRGTPGQCEAPVTIGPTLPGQQETELLINLTDEALPDSGAFARIAEIVTSDEDSRRQSRQRYARYRELGHTLETHKL